MACTSADSLGDEILLGAGAVLVAEECLDHGAHAVLRHALEAQPPWSDLPILVLTRSGADSITVGEAIASLGNVTLLERPLRIAGLLSVVRSALRARFRQYQIQANLKTLEEARDAESMAARRKDEFLAMLAHELRNPLAPIRTGLFVLAMDDSDAERRHTLLKMMERQVDHLVRLVDDLLESSRLSRGKIQLQCEAIDLRDALLRAAELSRSQIEAANCSLELELPDEPLPVNADPIRIAQVSGQVATAGFTALLHLTAVLSVSIGLLNLFPIPLLDGGHLLFYLVEAVRGRPLSERAQEVGFRIGLAIVLMLMIFATFNDILHLATS